jgi:hypothetical protein
MLRALAYRTRGDAARAEGCLDDATAAALAEGSLDAAARTAVMPHLAACVRCRHLVATVAAALSDRDVARAILAAESGARPRWRVPFGGRTAAGVAAAAILLLLTWPAPPEDVSPHRASPITAAPAPDAVAPLGAVAGARALRWTAVPGSDRYRVTLFDAEGNVLYGVELAHTVVALPDSVLPAPGGTYWWTVEARLGFDRWVASDLFEFSVVGGARP